jgi:dihydroorotate dehydrogenase
MAKHDLIFTPPIMNASGCLGFAPDVYGSVEISQLGAFITNPISLSPRTPAQGTRFIEYPGGFLLHTGFPNPGLTAVLRRYSRHWSRSPVPVIIHLLARATAEVTRMVRQLEGVEGVTGLEIGFTSDASSETIEGTILAASGELPVIAQLPIERSIELAGKAIQAGAMAVSLAAPRGSLSAKTGELVQGRLYGPSVLPSAIRAVKQLNAQGVSVIGSGGIYSRDDIQVMLTAGSIAVQLDSLLWRGAGFLPSLAE